MPLIDKCISLNAGTLLGFFVSACKYTTIVAHYQTFYTKMHLSCISNDLLYIFSYLRRRFLHAMLKVLFLHGFFASGQCVPANALRSALAGKAVVASEGGIGDDKTDYLR